MEIADTFHEFAIILLLGAFGGFLGQIFKQPLIVSLIAVGILVGPSGLDILSSNINVLSQIGISVLLFVVGLKLDVSEMKNLGRVSLLTGLGQVLFTSLVGFGIAKGMGYDFLKALYVAIALTFSSTIIIVKLLSDKKEVDSLHGRIAIGFLIVQDVVVIVMMIGLSAIGLKTSTEGGGQSILLLTAKGLGLVIGVPLFGRFVLRPLLPSIVGNKELLVLFSIAWATTISAAGEYIGVGKEVGAFLAGISLANAAYHEVIEAKLVTLRDFLLFFFFIHLGATLDISILGEGIFDSIIFSLFVLIGNPLIVIIIMGLLGYSKRTGFFAGLTVAQISEFSLIFVAMGMSLGHIDKHAMSVVTLVGLITIATSTYMILYSSKLYHWFSPVLGFFERGTTLQGKDAADIGDVKDLDVIVMGIGRFGRHIVKELTLRGWKILAVDFDPEVVEELKDKGFIAMYGDVEDSDLINILPFHKVRAIISTIPYVDANNSLISSLDDISFKGKVVVAAHYEGHEVYLLEKGADLVVLPFRDAIEGFCRKFNELMEKK